MMRGPSCEALSCFMHDMTKAVTTNPECPDPVAMMAKFAAAIYQPELCEVE